MLSPLRRHVSTLLAAALALCAAAAFAAAPAPAASSHPGSLRVYVGTYTSGRLKGEQSKGIYRLRLDLATGALTPEGAPTQTVNPSFLALHPSGRLLYAVNELGDKRGAPGGAVSAFAVDPASGDLKLLNQQPSGGAAPCHLLLDAKGRHLLVANYWGGNVSIFPVGSDGRLGAASGFVQHEGQSPSPREDMGPHAHMVVLDAAERFAIVTDLGLDKIFIYPYEAAKDRFGTDVRDVSLPFGAGPRHFAFAPGGRHAYVLGELNSSVTAYQYAPATGILTWIQAVSTLPAGFKGTNSGAELVVRPDGRFVYASNRGDDSIAIFAVDQATGKLSLVGFQPTLGKTPRNFAIDPTGMFLLAANQDSDSVVVFRIDAQSGKLSVVGSPVTVPRPVCLLMTAPPARKAVAAH
jgi:6-phosphogluconolactonase